MGGVSNRIVPFHDNATFSGTIKSIAKCGVHEVEHTPSSDSGAILTGTMQVARANLEGVDMTGSSHMVASYAMMHITGDGDSAQHFIDESKLDYENTGTCNLMVHYQPAIDSINGTLTNYVILDNTIDITTPSVSGGITGSVTNPWLLRNTGTSGSLFKIETNGQIIGATGHEVMTKIVGGVVDGHYYGAVGLASRSAAALTRGITWITPVYIPERTTFTRIGIEVTTGVASTTIRLGIYSDSVAGAALVLDAGTVDSSITGEKEITISQSLEAGLYFFAAQPEGGASDPSVNYASMSGYSHIWGRSAVGTLVSTAYIANTGALAATLGTPTYADGSGTTPDVWVRKV